MIDLVYILIATNILSVFGFTLALYKTVTQLSSKIISPNINTYKIAERKAPDAPQTPLERHSLRGRPIKDERVVPIDEADPNEVMRSLAASSGRLDDFTPLEDEEI